MPMGVHGILLCLLFHFAKLVKKFNIPIKPLHYMKIQIVLEISHTKALNPNLGLSSSSFLSF